MRRLRGRPAAPTGKRPARWSIPGWAIVACGAASIAFTVLSVVAAVWAMSGGKAYTVTVDATIEWMELEVSQTDVSRIALLNAYDPVRKAIVTGTLLPAEKTIVTFERRGMGEAKVVLLNAGRSAGQFENRSPSAPLGELLDLGREAAFRVQLQDAGKAGECQGSVDRADCRPPGALRAALQGPINLGEEMAAAAMSTRMLAPGGVPSRTITLHILGRTSWFPADLTYELGTFTLPPDARLKPAEGRPSASLWSASIAPGRDGGFSVQVTTSARNLRVFSAAGPVHGDSISAGFLAVLFSDPEIAGLAAVAAALGAIAQLLATMRGQQESGGSRAS